MAGLTYAGASWMTEEGGRDPLGVPPMCLCGVGLVKHQAWVLAACELREAGVVFYLALHPQQPAPRSGPVRPVC